MKRYAVFGAGNIGFGVIEKLAEEAEVCVFDLRKPDYLSAFMDMNDRVSFIEVDATSEDSVDGALSSFPQGYFDAAILTVGISSSRTAYEDFNAFRKTVDINFFGNIVPIRVLVRRELFRNPAKIEVLTSTSGHFAGLTTNAYAPSKWMLVNACESIRTELEEKGITLDMINPRTIKNIRSDEFKSDGGIDVSDVVDTILKAMGGVRRRITLFPENTEHFTLSSGLVRGCLI